MATIDPSQLLRTDISDVIVHWTKKNLSTKLSAFDTLKKILKEETLNGESGFIKGSYKCVCFTETPIPDLIKVFAISNKLTGLSLDHRYSPFGIAYKKTRLYDVGGRPVIYSSENEYQLLPEGFKWRYVNYIPERADFTWEREWRIKAEKVKITPENSMVIVPNGKYYDEIIKEFGSKWKVMSLSILGMPHDWVE